MVAPEPCGIKLKAQRETVRPNHRQAGVLTTTSGAASRPAPPATRRPAAQRRAPGVHGPGIERGRDWFLGPPVDQADDLPEPLDLGPGRRPGQARQAARWSDPDPRLAATATGRRVAHGPHDDRQIVAAGRTGVGDPEDHPALGRRRSHQAPVVGPGDEVEQVTVIRRREDRVRSSLVGATAADRQGQVGPIPGRTEAVEEAGLGRHGRELARAGRRRSTPRRPRRPG